MIYRREITEGMGNQLARQLDAVIGAAITRHIGEDWVVSDLAGRLCSVRKFGDSFDVYSLDGKAILELHDPEWGNYYHAPSQSWSLNYVQKYRYL